MNERIEIPLSKIKIFWLLLGGILFVTIGVLFVSNPEGYVSLMFGSPEIIWFGGALSLSFFGFISIFIIKKIFDKKPGLIIDERGITDNSTITSVGLIEWKDITGIRIAEVASTKCLILKVKRPDKYIKSGKSKMQRKTLEMNNSIYGSPITIISGSLKMKFEDLHKLIESELKKRI